MVLKIFLPFFLLISLPSWESANACEKGFSAGEVFISFAKKQLGKSFEKKIGPEWSEKIIENVKHWNRTEASQFLDFLIDRIGKEKAADWLMLSTDFPKMSVNQLMKKIAAYDQINKEIITSILKQAHRISLPAFLKGNNINNVKKIYFLIESYIGEQGAVYLLSDPTTYKIFSKSNPNEIKKVIDFVDDYTQKHALIIDTLNNRVDYFRQIISLPSDQAHMSHIKFNNLSELKEFGKLIFKKLRELDKEIEEKNLLPKDDLAVDTSRFNLKLIQLSRIATMFSAYFKSNFQNLKDTVAILEQYIKPEEIANMMMNSTTIYSVNPRNLKAVIDLLKKAHSIPSQENIHEVKERILKKIEEERQKGNIDSDLAKPITKIIEQMNKPPLKPEAFISYMIRKYSGYFLLADPINMKKVMDLLEKNYTKNKWNVILQPNSRHKEIQLGLLLADPVHLEKVLNIFEKYLEKDEIIYIIIHKFTDISMIKEDKIDHFTKVVEILGTHIDIKDVLAHRIIELLENDVFSSEIYYTLTKISNTSDPNTMKKSLTELSLLEFIPSIQEVENSMAEEPSATLH